MDSKRGRFGPLLVAVGCLACAIPATCLFSGCEDSSSSNSSSGISPYVGNNDANIVLALGDSITAAGYPEAMGALTAKSVINGGHGGDTSAEGVDVISSALGTYQPGYLLVLYGANDIIQDVDEDFTVSNLEAILQAAIADTAVPVIGTLTPMIGVYSKWNSRVLSLNTRIAELASQMGVSVADLYTSFTGDELTLTSTDGLHPSAAGNAVIAATFLDAIP